MFRKYIRFARKKTLTNMFYLGLCRLSFGQLKLLLQRSIVTLLIALPFFSYSAYAALIGDMFRPYVDYQVVFDDNILRIRDQMNRQNVVGTNKLSDISQRITGGLIFEKKISRQRFSAEGNWSHTYFDRFRNFNHDAQNVNGNWNWFLGKNFEGNMGATYVKDLAPFLFQPGIRNLQTIQTQYFNTDWRFHSNWGLHGGYNRYDQSSNNILTKFLDREEHIFDFAVNYFASDTNKVGVLFRHTQGDFPLTQLAPDGSVFDNSFNQNEVRAVIDWILSGKSWVQFSGGWVERNNASFSERDFNGFNARMLYFWRLTDKAKLAVSGWRETGAVNAINARFSLNTGVSVSPSWDLTDKLKLQGEFLYEERKFTGFSGLNNPIPTGINNTILDGSLGLIYTPYTGIQVSALVFRNELTSQDLFGDVTANGASISIRYTYKKYDK